MAKRQTRRAISFNRHVYDAIKLEAERRGLSASHFVEKLVRRVIKGLPKTHHTHVEKAQRIRARHSPRTAFGVELTYGGWPARSPLPMKPSCR